MHPAFSVILFTTLSGLGYGLAFVLGLGLVATPVAQVAWPIAFVLISIGLLCSTFHLGHPERAWRALSQWRSSWLSREGVMAILTYIPLMIGACAAIFCDQQWAVAGWLTAAMAVLTVYCTAMIYASLRSVYAWATPLTAVVFLSLSLSGGLLLASWLSLMFDQGPMLAQVATVVVALAALAKAAWWQRQSTTDGASTLASATGLGSLGDVRLLESPHGTENYLTREMAFVIGRRHARKLRMIAAVSGVLVPVIANVLATAIGSGFAASLCAFVALAGFALGVLVERWLFFAEAKHSVSLYYGAQSC